MKTFQLNLAVGVLASLTISASAATRYVDLNSPSPTSPYTSWATAATNIQDAIDAANSGDQILVTNGVYQTGGRLAGFPISSSNRVAVTKPVVVYSVNGPASTMIKGNQVPDTILGFNAIRCVYLADGATLMGFTLTNGSTRVSAGSTGGGVFCTSVSAVVSNCVLVGNAADQGGGAFSGTLCNSIIANNYAVKQGGAGYSNIFISCAIYQNTAAIGGAAYASAVTNCTIIGNFATNSGGGIFSGAARNSIIFFNRAPSGSNYIGSILDYCCTHPLPAGGSGNFNNDPLLASFSHISSGSPCRGAGNSAYASVLDIDGETWSGIPSVGCDEFNSGSVTGAVNVMLRASYTNVATGFDVGIFPQIEGRVSASRWEFGDGTILSNQVILTHSWPLEGDYQVILRAYNETYPTGITATLPVRVLQNPTHFVSISATGGISPYLSWQTAASNIQVAVDAAYAGGTVLVSNGVYSTGQRVVYGSMSNRVVIHKPITVRSLNGPAVTIIKGFQVPGTTNGNSAVRGVYLTNDAILSGFTLTNGATRIPGDLIREGSGGGAWCESSSSIVSNCVLSGNVASYAGGGVHSGTLYGCVITRNLLTGDFNESFGAGAVYSILNNCTLTSNRAVAGSFAGTGGGLYGGVMSNCIASENFAGAGGAASHSTVYGCTVSNNIMGGGGGGVHSCDVAASLIISNRAAYGGGGDVSTFTYCTIMGNVATETSCCNDRGGGGANYSVLNNCSVIGNRCGRQGGGTYQSTLNNCTLIGNVSDFYGGAAHLGKLNNCNLIENSAAVVGGGGYNCTLNNCIVISNSAPSGANYSGGGINYSCTFPLPPTSGGGSGIGNISASPMFVDQSGGDFHLQSNSPCINAGKNAYAPTGFDLNGNPRIVGGTVDIGAYEFQSPSSVLSYAWAQQYGLPTDGSADFTDNDSDSHNNWQEWKADTIPTNSQSVLRMASISNGLSGTLVKWQSTDSRTYFLQRAPFLPSFSNLASNIVGQPSTTTYTDTAATNNGPFFYRVGVQE